MGGGDEGGNLPQAPDLKGVPKGIRSIKSKKFKTPRYKYKEITNSWSPKT